MPKALTALKIRNSLPPSLRPAAAQQAVWAVFHLFSTANAKEEFQSGQTIKDFGSYQLSPEERLMDYLSCCTWGLNSLVHPRVRPKKANLCFGKINLLKLVWEMGNFPSVWDSPSASVLFSIAITFFFLRLCFPHFFSLSTRSFGLVLTLKSNSLILSPKSPSF